MPSLDDLENRLRDAPDDSATWLVYADALQERGDARGDVIALGERLRGGDTTVAARYAERCRAARWPRGAPFPKMSYRVRFEQMFAELRSRSNVTVRSATIEAAVPEAIDAWKPVAGAAWPPGMTELYSEVSRVDLEWSVEGEDGVSGAIHIPDLRLWDHAGLEDELWFDFTEDDSALHAIRPIDRFTAEAYAVLFLDRTPAEVAYHYCGESLVPAGLSYREWLELLFRARGVQYWIQLALGPPPPPDRETWVEEGIARAAKLFPDFDPASMSPARQRLEVDL